MARISETGLPGIGKKYQVQTDSGETLVIVIHNNGRRELFTIGADEEEPLFVASLTDPEARQVGSIIEGAFYQPQDPETICVSLPNLMIEWYKIRPDSPILGRTIGELRIREFTGATIIAIIRDKGEDTDVNPGPSAEFRAGDTVVVAGRKAHVLRFEKLLREGEG